MGIESTKMLENYFTSWNSQDVEGILSFFIDDCLYEDVTPKRIVRGKAELRALLESVLADIAGLRMEIKSVFSAGDGEAANGQ